LETVTLAARLMRTPTSLTLPVPSKTFELIEPTVLFRTNAPQRLIPWTTVRFAAGNDVALMNKKVGGLGGDSDENPVRPFVEITMFRIEGLLPVKIMAQLFWLLDTSWLALPDPVTEMPLKMTALACR